LESVIEVFTFILPSYHFRFGSRKREINPAKILAEVEDRAQKKDRGK